MKLSKAQIEALWVTHGGKPSARQVAAAVALAESSGDTNNTNHNTDGSTDRGLWQINSVHGAESTYNITANTLAAIHISNNGTNWQPWTTYKTGAYRQYMGAATPTSAGVFHNVFSWPWESESPQQHKESEEIFPEKSLGLGPHPLPNPLSTVGGLVGFIQKLFEPAFWIRVGKVLVGLFLLLSGVLGMGNISADPAAIVEHSKKARNLALAAGAI